MSFKAHACLAAYMSILRRNQSMVKVNKRLTRGNVLCLEMHIHANYSYVFFSNIQISTLYWCTIVMSQQLLFITSGITIKY